MNPRNTTSSFSKREKIRRNPFSGPHFGLDVGLANLTVLSGPGVVQFFDGKPLRYVRGRYFRYRQALQRKRKIGMVKRSKGRESRWVRCENHRVSRQIVDTVTAKVTSHTWKSCWVSVTARR